jgi:ankyrin repeat protein
VFKALCLAGVTIEALDFALPRITHSGYGVYDAKGFTVLDPALDRDLAKSLEVTLDGGADPNVRDRELGETTLHKLARCPGGGESLSLMLKRGADPNLLCFTGKRNARTALQNACRAGNLISISLLLQNAADAAIEDEQKNTFLHLAAEGDKLDIIEQLFQTNVPGAGISLPRNTTGETPLHNAARNGNVLVVQFFHDHGANINDATPAGWTPLLYSLGSHYGWETWTVTSYLLEHGADTRARCAGDWTAFHVLTGLSLTKHAVDLKNYDADFRLLIERGADVNAKASSGGKKSRFGLNQFQKGYVDLLQSTAPESLVSDETPLHWAAGYSSSHHVRLLLSLGANIEARDSTGATPLIRAIKDIGDDAVCPEAVIELLGHGADEWAQDNSGLNARDWGLKRRLLFDWESKSIPEAAPAAS